ncbi:Heavy metal transport/detoxification superfamily protein [Prunus dulcis]|uniref:Heavy metal transport/detoxification superfamily protein n=1 Tax=Prunus dulcis TaxID=3755 RepID=A0A4Y1R924_PRUDU|nr:Heavy metal transport/detoxification superfamily protein [Prunus dulcis]
MAEKEKETIMVLKVDLQCHKCYKKVKKSSLQIPSEIQDQIYDEKQTRWSSSGMLQSREDKGQDTLQRWGSHQVHSDQRETKEEKPKEEKPKEEKA